MQQIAVLITAKIKPRSFKAELAFSWLFKAKNEDIKLSKT